MEPNWETSYQAIGVGHRDATQAHFARSQRDGGLSSAAAAYHGAANDYPRFERQMIRAVQDEGITSGAKQPHPELLRRFPNREYPHEKDLMATRRPTTGASAVSGRSDRSVASMYSRRSSGRSGRSSAVVSAAGSAISRTSSVPPSGYHRQVLPPPFTYTVSSNAIGAGGHVGAEPCPGREAWMLGRGGGQQSSFDSCLVRKYRHD